MLATTGADIAIHNTGGIRSTGEITAGGDVTLNQLYEICPFDNNIYLIEVTYQEIESLLNNNSIFYSLAADINLNDSSTYTVAVISYVYYWDQLDNIRSDQNIDTELYIRDVLVEDIRLKGLAEELFSPISNPLPTVGLLYE